MCGKQFLIAQELEKYFLPQVAVRQDVVLQKGGLQYKYRFAKKFFLKTRKIAYYYLHPEKGADKAQRYLHFTSPVFDGITIYDEILNLELPQRLALNSRPRLVNTFLPLSSNSLHLFTIFSQ